MNAMLKFFFRCRKICLHFLRYINIYIDMLTECLKTKLLFLVALNKLKKSDHFTLVC